MATALAEPHAIKISSKRQITIPAEVYKKHFGEYALATWTDEGLLIQPLDSEDEDISVGILRDLIRRGYEGEELLEQYQKELKGIGPMLQEVVAQAQRELQSGAIRNASDEELFGC